MTLDQSIILDRIKRYWIKNPSLRFGQVLFNLNVNQFSNLEFPEQDEFKLRDIHADTDAQILDRMPTVKSDDRK